MRNLLGTLPWYLVRYEEDFVCLLSFSQLCKMILFSVLFKVQPIYYLRHARKLKFPLNKWLKVPLLCCWVYFKWWGNRRESRDLAVKDLIFSARRSRSLPVCIWLAPLQGGDAVKPSNFEIAPPLSCIIQVRPHYRSTLKQRVTFVSALRREYDLFFFFLLCILFLVWLKALVLAAPKVQTSSHHAGFSWWQLGINCQPYCSSV